MNTVDGRAGAEAADDVANRAERAGDHSGALLARAMALILRSGAGDVLLGEEAEELCHRALPAEEARGDARRLALLWELVAVGAHHRMRNDAAVEAAACAIGYQHLGGGSSMGEIFDWALVLGTRAAEEGLRMLDELEGSRPPGAGDLSRAVHLAMVGRFDEAWALAQARAHHLHEVTGSPAQGADYLAHPRDIEGDRERECRHHRDLLAAIPSGTESIAASFELPLARASATWAAMRRSSRCSTMLALFLKSAACARWARASRHSARRTRTARRGGGVGAHRDRCRTRRHGQSLARGVGPRGPRDRARARRKDRRGARGARARDQIWERKGCLPCADRIRAQIDSLGRAPV